MLCRERTDLGAWSALFLNRVFDVRGSAAPSAPRTHSPPSAHRACCRFPSPPPHTHTTSPRGPMGFGWRVLLLCPLAQLQDVGAASAVEALALRKGLLRSQFPAPAGPSPASRASGTDRGSSVRAGASDAGFAPATRDVLARRCVGVCCACSVCFCTLPPPPSHHCRCRFSAASPAPLLLPHSWFFLRGASLCAPWPCLRSSRHRDAGSVAALSTAGASVATTGRRSERSRSRSRARAAPGSAPRGDARSRSPTAGGGVVVGSRRPAASQPAAPAVTTPGSGSRQPRPQPVHWR
jgi:hypothetical protein